MKQCATILLAAMVWATPTFAGVIYEMETTDHTHNPPTVSTSRMSVAGPLLKIDNPPGSTGSKGELIFRGDSREMVMVNHDTKSYMVMDEAGITALMSQLSSATNAIAEALKNVPESQRAMVEKMMKDRMPQQAPKLPPVELEKTNDRGERNGYPCVKYVVLRGDSRIRDLWIASWSDLEGGSDLKPVFHLMTEFLGRMMEAITSQSGLFGMFGAVADNSFSYLEKIDGFPAASVDFADDGSVKSEANLRSVEQATLTPADFEPPEGYKRRDMTPPAKPSGKRRR